MKQGFELGAAARAMVSAGLRVQDETERAVECHAEERGAGLRISLVVQVVRGGHVSIERVRVMEAAPRAQRLSGHQVRVTGTSTEDLHWESVVSSVDELMALVGMARGNGSGRAEEPRSRGERSGGAGAGRANGFPAAAWRGAD